MPVLLKDVKRSLERDLGKVGRKVNGDYKFTPPNIVARKLNSYASLPVTKTDGAPNFRKGTMIFQGLVKSQTDNTRYLCQVQFFEIPFVVDQDPLHAIPETIMKKSGVPQTMFRGPANIRKSPVALRCECKDFQHRFSYPLADADSLIGKPIPYTRITKPWPIGYPSANSTEKIGICKHLNSFINELNRTGQVTE